MHYPTPIAKLIESYMKLPGIGAKTATRLAFYTINMREEDVTEFAKSLISVKRDLHYCDICGNITDEATCDICRNPNRDKSTILVVEETKGLYHVLNGVLSPMDGTGPDDLNIASLIKRLHGDEVKEVIIATNATTDGEATAMYLSRLIKPAGIKVTRLAHGLSVGSDIEYADEITLLKAVEGRTEL
jgi:recombination protein RecR